MSTMPASFSAQRFALTPVQSPSKRHRRRTSPAAHAKEGYDVGTAVGSVVGSAVGAGDGRDVGRALGRAVGVAVGREVGAGEGGVVGVADGSRVGSAVGACEGGVVGAADGGSVGAGEGAKVGGSDSVGTEVGCRANSQLSMQNAKLSTAASPLKAVPIVSAPAETS